MSFPRRWADESARDPNNEANVQHALSGWEPARYIPLKAQAITSTARLSFPHVHINDPHYR